MNFSCIASRLFFLLTLITAPFSQSADAERNPFPGYKPFKAQRINKFLFEGALRKRIGMVLHAASGGAYAIEMAKKVDKGGLIYVVDPWESMDKLAQFNENVRKAGMQLRIHPIRMEIDEALQYFLKEFIGLDFLFWDGEANEEGIQKQIQGWWPLICDNGQVAGDDYASSSVVQAVDAVSSTWNVRVRGHTIWGGAPHKIWVMKKRVRHPELADFHDENERLAEALLMMADFKFGCEVINAPADRLGLSQEDRTAAFAALSQRTRKAALSLPEAIPQGKIPKKHHTIWLTDAADPKDPANLMRGGSEPLLTYYDQSMQFFDGEWEHILWCLFPEQIPNTVAHLRQKGVEVRSIYDPTSDVYRRMPARHVFDMYLMSNHFTLAGNILREAIVYLFGGFYKDISIELLMNPAPVLSVCDVLYASRKYSKQDINRPSAGKEFNYLDHDVCAGVQGNLVQGKLLENLDKLYDYGTEGTFGHAVHEDFAEDTARQIELTRPPHIMLAVNQAYQEEGSDPEALKVLWCNERPLFCRHSNGSWIHGLWGCGRAYDSQVNLFSVKPPPHYDKISWAHATSIHNIPVLPLHRVLEGTEGEVDDAYKEGVRRLRGQVYKNTVRTLLQLDALDKVGGEEPLLFHRIWLTDQEHPTEVSEDFMTKFKESMALQESDAVAYFWCQDPEKLPETIKAFSSFPRRVEVKKIDDEMGDFGARWLYDFYVSRQVWALGGDILRHFIVNMYGGLYTDMGMELRVNMAKFMRSFDLILANREKWLDMCVLGVQKGNAHHAKFLDFLSNMRTVIPQPLQYTELKPNLHLHNSHGLASWIDTINPDEAGLLLLPDDSVFKKHGLRSWWDQKAGHGNSVHSKSISSDNFFTLP